MEQKIIKCPEAKGFHWHPPFECEQINSLVKKESERAKMALIFFKKHSNLRVRFIIQLTFLHRLLWGLVCLGGIINVRTITPLLKYLVKRGKNSFALELLKIPLNLIYIKELYKAFNK